MTTTEPGDLLWGAQAIADYIQRPVRSAYYLIGRGVLPITKMGPRTIVARKSDIDRAFSSDNSPPRQANADSRIDRRERTL